MRVPSRGNVSGYDCNPCSPRRERDTASLCHTCPCLGVACFIAKADSVVCRCPFVASEYAVTCYVMTQHQSGLGEFHSFFRRATLRGFPEVSLPTQCLVPFSGNKGYSRNPRRFPEQKFIFDTGIENTS